MSWLEQYSGATATGERAEKALRMPLGAVSPLWFAFGAAASAGVAFWWMTQWSRKVNVEALAGAPLALPKIKAKAPTETPAAEPVAEAAPAPEPVAAAPEAAPVAVTPEPEPVAEPQPAIEAEAPAALEPQDLTVMTGIGPKLLIALAERGVTRFSQIAAWTEADLAEIDLALSLKGRAVREDWVAQAKRLADA